MERLRFARELIQAGKVREEEKMLRLSQLAAGSPDYLFAFTAPAVVPEPGTLAGAMGAAAAFAAMRRARR